MMTHLMAWYHVMALMELDGRMLVMEESACVGMYIDVPVMMIFDAATSRWCCYN